MGIDYEEFYVLRREREGVEEVYRLAGDNVHAYFVNMLIASLSAKNLNESRKPGEPPWEPRMARELQSRS